MIESRPPLRLEVALPPPSIRPAVDHVMATTTTTAATATEHPQTQRAPLRQPTTEAGTPMSLAVQAAVATIAPAAVARTGEMLPLPLPTLQALALAQTQAIEEECTAAVAAAVATAVVVVDLRTPEMMGQVSKARTKAKAIDHRRCTSHRQVCRTLVLLELVAPVRTSSTLTAWRTLTWTSCCCRLLRTLPRSRNNNSNISKNSRPPRRRPLHHHLRQLQEMLSQPLKRKTPPPQWRRTSPPPGVTLDMIST